jgi:hypothetical protein
LNLPVRFFRQRSVSDFFETAGRFSVGAPTLIFFETAGEIFRRRSESEFLFD